MSDLKEYDLLSWADDKEIAKITEGEKYIIVTS